MLAVGVYGRWRPHAEEEEARARRDHGIGIRDSSCRQGTGIRNGLGNWTLGARQGFGGRSQGDGACGRGRRTAHRKPRKFGHGNEAVVHKKAKAAKLTIG